MSLPSNTLSVNFWCCCWTCWGGNGHFWCVWGGSCCGCQACGGCWVWHMDIDYLKRMIRHCPDWFLDELQYLLQTNWFIAAHFTTIHQKLVQAGISNKKIFKNSFWTQWKFESQLHHMNGPVQPRATWIYRRIFKRWMNLYSYTRAIEKGIPCYSERSFRSRTLFLCNWPSHTLWNGVEQCCRVIHDQSSFLKYLEFSVVVMLLFEF